MSIFRNNNVGNYTRGGQAIVHNVRMSTQVFFQTFVAAFLLWIMGAGWYFTEVTSKYDMYTLAKWTMSQFKSGATYGAKDVIKFKTPRAANTGRRLPR